MHGPVPLRTEPQPDMGRGVNLRPVRTVPLAGAAGMLVLDDGVVEESVAFTVEQHAFHRLPAVVQVDDLPHDLRMLPRRRTHMRIFSSISARPASTAPPYRGDGSRPFNSSPIPANPSARASLAAYRCANPTVRSTIHRRSCSGRLNHTISNADAAAIACCTLPGRCDSSTTRLLR